jgi:NAD(P)H-dependent flavin oxidoreductase YrpB (nitropropane dioxygenase family)
MTTLQSLLGTGLPIIQAPMAGVQGSETLRGELAALAAGTDKPMAPTL